MTAVFVHGVPETPAVWHGLLAALDRPDTVALSLPGFDSARPAGFGATMDEYASWLAAQLERLGDPVDLVGHDWGGGFVVRVVSTRPELVRSWVTDAAGLGDVEFEWHDFAKIWQTPQAGEDFWDQQLAASTQERAGVFQMFGVPEEAALVDETARMKGSSLGMITSPGAGMAAKSGPHCFPTSTAER